MYKYTFDHKESFHTNNKKKKEQSNNALYLKALPKYKRIDFHVDI